MPGDSSGIPGRAGLARYHAPVSAPRRAKIAAGEAPRPAAALTWLCGLALAATAVFVFRGALHTYFAQEDFRGLAVAAGVLPRHASLWRWVSVQGFMDACWPLFRDQSLPYHAVVLALHVANALALFALLSGPCGRPAALLGATFFAVHPALFTALYWQSARADVLAASFALLTVGLVLREGRERWLAVPAFALALLSKESVLPLPAALFFVQRWRASREAPPRRGLDPLAIVLGLLSLVYGMALFAPRGAGIAIGFDPAAAYGLDLGGAVLRNLLTYAGWAVDLPRLTPGLRYVDAPNPDLFPLGAVVLTAAGVAASAPRLRARGFHLGLLGFLLLLAPVLPLRNHTYHYYLYAPLLAFALCLSAVLAALSEGIGPRGRWAIAVLGGVLLTWNGDRLVQHMEARHSLVYPELRGDPIVDRAAIAARAIESLRQAALPAGTELVLLSRERVALLGRIVEGSREAPPPAEEAYPESNVRTALFGGIAVRALIPAVDSVAFNRNVGAGTERRRYGLYAPTGEVEVYGAAGLDSLLRTSWVRRW
jgi:hypothetical protein